MSVSYTHLRAHETSQDLVCRLLLENGGGGGEGGIQLVPLYHSVYLAPFPTHTHTHTHLFGGEEKFKAALSLLLVYPTHPLRLRFKERWGLGLT